MVSYYLLGDAKFLEVFVWSSTCVCACPFLNSNTVKFQRSQFLNRDRCLLFSHFWCQIKYVNINMKFLNDKVIFVYIYKIFAS